MTRIVNFFISLSIICTSCKYSANPTDVVSEGNTLINKALKQAEWETISTTNFNIYAVKESYTAKNLKTNGATLEAARTIVMNSLDVKDLDDKTTVFYVEEREQMKALVGSAVGGWTEPMENAIFFVQQENAPAAVRHELGHLYSWRNWGLPKAYWLSEGVAVYAVGDCAGISLHAWAASLTREGNIVPMTQLEQEDFDFSKAAPHLQAGSFVQFVIYEFGIEALKKFWKNGIGSSLEATGKDLKDLEQLWLQHISQKEFVEAGLTLNTEGRIRCE